MTLSTAIFLFFAGALAAAINSVAGGGGFVALPALLFAGVSPIPANATQTLALFMGITASGGSYKDRLTTPWRILGPLLIASIVGGIAGAVLLLRTPASLFLNILPWLLLAATLLFLFGKRFIGERANAFHHDATTTAIVAATLFELVVSIYGGYFGGGLGIMNLAMLAMLGMDDIHDMNAIKAVLGAVINGTATVLFLFKGAVVWQQGAWMIAGAICGGWLGAHYAQKLPPKLVRTFVSVIGVSMTIYFFWRAYA